MPPGLASVIVQSQALFTIVFAAVALGERPTRRQWTGVAVALAGLAAIATTVGANLTLAGLLLTLVSPSASASATCSSSACARQTCCGSPCG